MKEFFDVIIVGGGMVGATLACALGDSKLSVAIIENTPPPPFSAEQPHDLRVSALSIASKNILDHLGAWEGIVQRRYCPFQRMRVWETTGDTEFCSAAIDHQALGYIVENRITQLALLDRLTEFNNIQFLCPVSIQTIHYTPGAHTELILSDGRVLSTPLIIAADGGQSKIRQAVNLGVTSWDYEQHAMVINVETGYEQQDITWQRFVPSGPQAFLPLSGRHGSIVWYNSFEEIQRLSKLPYPALKEELIAAFPVCLGHINQIVGTASFPLKRQHAQHYIKPGVALIGDAAHTINPLAGQGVNIGLLDAAALAEVILEAHANGLNIADVKVLKRYEAMRRTENLKIMTVMDAFYLAFSNNILPLKIVRNLGLSMAERLLPIKNLVMRAAMGLDGPLPKLAMPKKDLTH